MSPADLDRVVELLLEARRENQLLLDVVTHNDNGRGSIKRHATAELHAVNNALAILKGAQEARA